MFCCCYNRDLYGTLQQRRGVLFVFFSLFILHVMKIIVLSLCFYVNCFSLCFFPALRFIIFKKPHQANHLALIEWIECKWSLVFFSFFFIRRWSEIDVFIDIWMRRENILLIHNQSPFSQSRNLFLNIILQIIGLICFILMSYFSCALMMLISRFLLNLEPFVLS